MATTNVFFTRGNSAMEVATYFDGENTRAPFAPNHETAWDMEEIERDLQKTYPGQAITIIDVQ